jgi:hypothetical protein
LIMRQYVQGITIEGLNVTVEGNTLTLSAGTITIPDGQATLSEDQTFTFTAEDAPSNVLIAFDRLGRLFVERSVRGKKPQSNMFGALTHLVYFDLPAGEVDLAGVIINVVRGR